MEEPRKFHKPGEASTWFKRLITRSTPSPTPAPTIPLSLAERRALLEERIREEKRWAEGHTGRKTSLDRPRERVDERITQLRDAQAYEAQLAAEHLYASGTHDVVIGRIDRRLREGASPTLHVFLSDVTDQLEALRTQPVEVREIVGPPDWDGKQATSFFSNGDSFRRRRDALVAAKAAAEAMLLDVVPEDELVARLTALRDAVPAIEPLTVELPSPLTPAEVRAAQWRAAEAAESKR